ncbi:hypothetical protein LJB89_00480 [Tyzzerella sp. OttesenSCG-928-J15]|nr:hypothetical protein [Tyzzerella sp. OttesenSCG-928-J15]
MKILSCGAGMQSTALALMACENKLKGMIHKDVPIYDAIIFADLGAEPEWVYHQVNFIANACKQADIHFAVLQKDLYNDYIHKFGEARVVAVPFWSIAEDGTKAKMQRHCTLDYKILVIQKYVKREMLHFKQYQHLRPEDLFAHEMHLGFSYEEKKRSFTSKNNMFVNRYPLAEMGWKREDTYKYVLETWGLETKASACIMCPFHRNYFFKHLKENYPDTDYKKLLELDQLLAEKQHKTTIRSQLFISRSRKRICELTDDDCNDAETFTYCDREIWNGF